MSKTRQEKKLDKRIRRQQGQLEERQFSAATIPPIPDAAQVRTLDAVAEIVEREIVERKVGVDESRQPRFTQDGNAFFSVVRWATGCMGQEPGSNASMQEWDRWYRDMPTKEPFLAGCNSSAVQIDVNRGWTFTGGRNQVAQYTKQAHSYRADITGMGWRPFQEWCASSFYATMMGFVPEVGSRGKDGPLTMLWAVDPCRCTLTGNAEFPLTYYPRNGGQKNWAYGTDFLRGVSQRSTDEGKFGYGFPAIARCYSLAKIMVGVYRHYMMKTGITTPDGILAHNAMSDEQWHKALEVRDQELLHNPDDYLNKIIAVGNPGGEVPQFVLTMLSNLPDRFDIETWTQILMRGYQLAFGYGAGEFYPEASGVIGRTKENENQQRASSSKGGRDYPLKFQEQYQGRLPGTIEFSFDERDMASELEEAQLATAWAATITEINKWVIKTNGVENSAVTAAQLIEFAAEKGAVPETWTPTEEDVTSTDEDAPDTERIYRAMRQFPDEQIVRYSSVTNKIRILRNPHRKVFAAPDVKRTVGQVVNEYNDALTRFVYDAFRNGDVIDLRRAHRALLRGIADRAFVEGLREGGADEPDEDDQAQIASWVSTQLASVNDFAAAVVAAGNDEAARAAIISRLGLWANAVQELGGLGKMSARKNAMLTFDGQDGQQTPCADCARMKGTRHRTKWWIKNNLVPRQGNTNYECGNWENCKHYLRKDDGSRFSA
jgi:hypothetical protein